MTKDTNHRRLPAEWEPQSGVLLAWPHEQTDWANQLAAVRQTFCAIIQAISQFEKVILVVDNRLETEDYFAEHEIKLERIIFFELPCNDTWARDFGPLCVHEGGQPLLLDFIFNGWGKKFAATQDNRLTRSLHAAGAFGTTACHTLPLVLEGGSIESDGLGNLLTTSACLLEKNRNPELGQQAIEMHLRELFGARQILWLDHGALQGDDTDSHIDTLVRMAPNNCLIYQGCDDPGDEHFHPLAQMRRQLESFRNLQGQPFRLLELPWPQACYDANGARLPATYANFLVINQAVLVPVYADPADAQALEIIKSTFAGREIIPIDCRSLIQQHGSLHCVTMQLPAGVLP